MFRLERNKGRLAWKEQLYRDEMHLADRDVTLHAKCFQTLTESGTTTPVVPLDCQFGTVTLAKGSSGSETLLLYAPPPSPCAVSATRPIPLAHDRETDTRRHPFNTGFKLHCCNFMLQKERFMPFLHCVAKVRFKFIYNIL